MFTSDPIYKRDSNGRIRIWQFQVDGTKWRTISGLNDGQKVVTEWTIAVAKSQPTAEQQAMFEAEAEQQKKLKRDYRQSIEDVDRTRESIIKPMLAESYAGWKFSSSKVYGQPKLDGIRCIANAVGLWSRSGQPIVSCPHVHLQLQPLFKENPNLILDGELYNHDLHDDFNEITSLVNTTKNLTAEHLAKTAQIIQYHVYDVYLRGDRFSNRFAYLEDLEQDFADSIRLVETVMLRSEQACDQAFEQFLSLGYEGMIVRLDDEYQQKRTKSLQKRKQMEDAEFDVVEILEGKGNGAGLAKRAVLKLPDGRTFKAGIIGNNEYCKRLLSQRWERATVQYLNLTPDGKPRGGKVKLFFNGERN